MTPEMEALARRAVACKGWRFMGGMRVLRTTHPVVQERGGPVAVPVRLMDSITDAEEVGGTTQRHGDLLDAGHAVVHGYHRVADMLPDLTDPATLGCLLALVREAFTSADRLWGGRIEVHQDSHCLFVVVSPEHDPNGTLYHRYIASGESEIEALVAAWEVHEIAGIIAAVEDGE